MSSGSLKIKTLKIPRLFSQASLSLSGLLFRQHSWVLHYIAESVLASVTPGRNAEAVKTRRPVEDENKGMYIYNRRKKKRKRITRSSARRPL